MRRDVVATSNGFQIPFVNWGVGWVTSNSCILHPTSICIELFSLSLSLSLSLFGVVENPFFFYRYPTILLGLGKKFTLGYRDLSNFCANSVAKWTFEIPFQGGKEAG